MTLAQTIEQTDQLLLLDGPTGTRLQYYGFDVDRVGWSARALVEAPDLVERVHRDYVDAGSRLITANTFRTHEANLQSWGQAGRAREFTLKAVELARVAAGERAWVLGSMAPIGDCYSPGEVPELETLFPQHRTMAGYLAEAGVDGILLETHVSLQEVLAAARAVQTTGLPLMVSVTSAEGARMLDGTSLADLAEQLEAYEPVAIGVNCIPVERVDECLAALKSKTECPLIVYANSGELTKQGIWKPTRGADLGFHTSQARRWLTAGVKILGGCCGTSPELIANFSRELPDRMGSLQGQQ